MRIIVIGASGFALEAAWLAEDCGHEVVGFLDDNLEKQSQTVMNRSVLGRVDQWIEFSDCFFVVAIGSPRIRYRVVQAMKSMGAPLFATLIHPSVIKSEYVQFGEGSLVCAGCVITVQVSMGEHCIINLNTTIGHETEIGNFVTVAPISAISGDVTIEDFVEVGTSSSIRQGLKLACGSMVGMGAVLTKDAEPFNVYAGIPAKSIKKLTDDFE